MAISNSIDFIVDNTDIVTEALELLGVLGEGETPNSAQMTSSSRTLNMMVKNWQAEGLNLFAVRTQYLFPRKNQALYALGDTTTDHFTEQFNRTRTTAAAIAGANVIEVEDVAGITGSVNIGIASGTDVQWTTVSGSVSGSDVTLTDTLTLDIPVGSIVYTYAQKASRPMKVLEGFIRLARSNTDIPLGNISRRRYNRLSVKATQGIVNQFYYDPQIAAGNLSLWPTTDDESNIITLFVQRTLSDLDSGTDNPEYPQEWYMPLAYNLALHLAPKYGIPPQDYAMVERQAITLYERAMGFDEELYTSVYFAVDYRGEEL